MISAIYFSKHAHHRVTYPKIASAGIDDFYRSFDACI